MKTILTCIGLWMTTLLAAQESYLLVGGSGWNQIALVEKESGTVQWSHQLGESEENNAVAVTADGDILYSYKQGAKLINLEHEVRWNYEAPKGAELFTANTLPDGGFLLGYCGHPARLIELNAQGVVRNEISFETGIEQVHGQFRQAIRSKRGTYLVPLMGKQVVIELDKAGRELNRWRVKGNPFSLVERANGNLIVGCGDAHLFLEIDRETGEICREVTNESIAASGCEFNFVAEIEQLSEERLLVCNWNGHLKSNQTVQPALLELDANNRVVWKLKENKAIGRISAVSLYPLSKQLKKRIKKINKS